MKLYGNAFTHGWPVLAITVLTAWVYCLHIALNQFILAAGRVLWFCICNGLWAVVVVAMAYCFVASGAEGLALARVVAYVLLVLLEWVLVRWQLQAMRASREAAPIGDADLP
jgi:O-antigen/teichoic acid export membrane protein